jgi:serine/threonine-protein kinase
MGDRSDPHDPAVLKSEGLGDPMSEMGQRLGSRYVLKERLGRGAMGTVWRAQNTDTGRFVAVKVLSEELSDEPDMVSRFIQERNTLIAVSHPNLVRIHDLVVEDGRLAIVMDLVNGPDLHRHLVERGVLSLPEAAVIGRGVASALAAIHAAGIIHRDL